MRKVILLCDACGPKRNSVAVAHLSGSLMPEGTRLELDLCKKHREQFLPVEQAPEVDEDEAITLGDLGSKKPRAQNRPLAWLHEPEGGISCEADPTCKRGPFKNFRSYDAHLRTDHPEAQRGRPALQEIAGKYGIPMEYPNLVCDNCGSEFTSASGLASHRRAQHGASTNTAPPDPRYSCDQCDFVAANGTGLGAHKRYKHGIKGASESANRKRSLLNGYKADGPNELANEPIGQEA